MGRTRNELMIDRMPPPAENRDSKREAALLSWIEQAAPYGVVTLDESFHVQSWNQWMEQHSGLPLGQVVGKSLLALFPDLQERKLVTHLERALQGESSVLSSSLHRYLLPLPSPFRITGQVQTLMLQTARIAPLFADGSICGVVLVIEDVTQREAQAEALGRQHRRDELLSWALAHLLNTDQPAKAIRQLFFKVAEQLDFDTFLIYLRDLETGQLTLEAMGGVPVECEKALQACPFPALVGGDPQEIVVLNSVQALREPQYAPLQKAYVSAAVALPLSAKSRNLGLLCFASWSRESIGAEEVELVKTIAQYLSTALDREATSRQLLKAKAELSEHAQLLERKVRERTARLQETVSELETFSYTIAHDLRAPVRTMAGYCEVLFDDFGSELSPEAKKILGRIARASGRMEALTRDLLEFSKVSRREVALGRVEVEPVLDELISLRPPAIRQAITIRAPLHPVCAQKDLLQQIFSNLIDNAVKFVRPDAGPRILIYSHGVPQSSPNTRPRPLIFSSIQSGSLEVAGGSGAESAPAKNSSERIRIWVEDEGIGIPPEAHQKIFGIFERGVTSDKYEGTGIGLAIVSRATQRMGGTCGVESEPGKGSRFWIELAAP